MHPSSHYSCELDVDLRCCALRGVGDPLIWYLPTLIVI